MSISKIQSKRRSTDETRDQQRQQCRAFDTPRTELQHSWWEVWDKLDCWEIPIKTESVQRIHNSVFEVTGYRTMHINACFALLLLAIALAQASPAPKIIEKKSLAEDTKLETKKADLKIEEAGEDKDRTKKSATTFCVQIKPGSTQPTQVPCPFNQAAAQRMPITVQSQSIPQQIQAMNLVQPVAQVPQANILVPQPVVPPFNTLQIVQPAAPPCMQPAPAVNIIQSIPQSNIVQHIPKPKPKPKPTSAPAVEIETITEAPQPERIEQFPESLPEPQETLAVMPYAPACHDHLITIPSTPLMLMTEPEPAQLATIIQVPSVASCNNPLHGVISPCSCQSNVAVLNEPSVESMSMKMLPVMSYSSSYARSPLMAPYVSNMVQRVITQPRAGPQDRTNTHIDAHMPEYRHHHKHHHQKVYLDTYVNNGPSIVPVPVPVQSQPSPQVNLNPPNGVVINAYPQSIGGITSMVQTAYRSADNTLSNGENASNNPVASGATYLQQTNKAPREIDSNQMASEKVEEIETEKGQALLIDGRRNARSNKEEAKDKKSVSATS